MQETKNERDWRRARKTDREREQKKESIWISQIRSLSSDYMAIFISRRCIVLVCAVLKHVDVSQFKHYHVKSELISTYSTALNITVHPLFPLKNHSRRCRHFHCCRCRRRMYKHRLWTISHFEVVCKPCVHSMNIISKGATEPKKPNVLHLTDLILHKANNTRRDEKKTSGSINIMRIRAGPRSSRTTQFWAADSFVFFPRRLTLPIHSHTARIMRFHFRFRCNQICNLSNWYWSDALWSG